MKILNISLTLVELPEEKEGQMKKGEMLYWHKRG